MSNVWITTLLLCGVQFADADESSNQSCVMSCVDNASVFGWNSTNKMSEQFYCLPLEIATCMDSCDDAANMSAIVSVLKWALRPICPAGTDKGRSNAYLADYDTIGVRLMDLSDGDQPEECRMNSFNLIRSPIDVMCRRHHCTEMLFNHVLEKSNTSAGPVLHAMMVLASLKQYTTEHGWGDVSKHKGCMMGFSWTVDNETSYAWPPSDPTSQQPPRPSGQLPPENEKHALDDGTERLTGASIPLESMLNTAVPNGGGRLPDGCSENVTVGPLASLEAQVKDSVDRNGNMMAMFLRSNMSGNLF